MHCAINEINGQIENINDKMGGLEMRKVIAFLFVCLLVLSPSSCFSETTGEIEIGGSYCDRSEVENIYFDGQLNVRKIDYEVKIEYSLLKSQTGEKVNSLRSKANIQNNFYSGLFGKGYGFIAGGQERHKNTQSNYDVTSLGFGAGRKEGDLKGIIKDYYIQAGLFANSEYKTRGMEKDIEIVPEAKVIIPLFSDFNLEEEAKAQIDYSYMKNWEGNNKLRVTTALNDHVDLGVMWLCKYKNMPCVDEPYAENIYMLSVKSKF